MSKSKKVVDIETTVKRLVTDHLESIHARYEVADEAGDDLVYTLVALCEDEEYGREAVMAAVASSMPPGWEQEHTPFGSIDGLIAQVDMELEAGTGRRATGDPEPTELDSETGLE